MNAGDQNSAANVTCTREGGSDDTYGEYADPFAAEGKTSSPSAPPAATPEEEKETAAPLGIAGFEFGMTQDEAANACSSAGHTWHGDAKPACSAAPVSVGIDSEVQLRFCDGGLCRAALAMTRRDQEFGDIEQTFVKLVKALKQKYGRARRLEIPSDACASDIPRCLRTGSGAMRAAWEWEGGHAIRLSVAIREGDATLTLLYKAPEAETSKALEGL